MSTYRATAPIPEPRTDLTGRITAAWRKWRKRGARTTTRNAPAHYNPLPPATRLTIADTHYRLGQTTNLAAHRITPPAKETP